VIKLKAFAKINFILQILGKRADGYHEIDSLMQSVSLYDEILVDKKKSGIELFLNDPNIPNDKRNTAYKAAELFFYKTKLEPSVKIDIRKNIPTEAGLGGASSDAAAVLIGLNRLFDANLSEKELLELGAQIGSDVSFCLTGGFCRCRGRGELVEKIDNSGTKFCADETESYDGETKYYVLVKPKLSILTKSVYDSFEKSFIEKENYIDGFLQHGELVLKNDLEKVVLPKHHEIGEIKNRLLSLGCLQSLMSGSGSSVFGLVCDKKKAYEICEEIKKKYSQSFVVEGMNVGIKE